MRNGLMVLIVLIIGSGICYADTIDLELSAGQHTLYGDVGVRKPTNNGYMKLGLSGLYSESDDTKFKWANLGLFVGNDNFGQGFGTEVGLKSIYGTAEDGHRSGDIAAVAFAGKLSYVFPKRIMPIPLEIFGGMAYSPDPLTFEDADNYTELNMGVGLRVLPNASVRLSYNAYDVGMDSESGKWDLDESMVRLGLTMSF
ncbi:MAG: hypothetical protein GY874_00610 [Desulfobacteraceae bacterium]|nr:hypothetical protein [Desulfobacteraceae bacterium]